METALEPEDSLLSRGEKNSSRAEEDFFPWRKSSKIHMYLDICMYVCMRSRALYHAKQFVCMYAHTSPLPVLKTFGHRRSLFDMIDFRYQKKGHSCV